METGKLSDDIDFESQIRNTNTRGDEFMSQVSDIIFHIINQSTHHRGQIMSEISKIGEIPILTGLHLLSEVHKVEYELYRV